MTAPAVARGGLAPSRNPSIRRSFVVPERFEHVDWILVASTVAVALLGVVMVYSATRGTDDDPTTYFLQRQAMFVVIGVGLMAAMAAFDYRRLRDWAIPIAGAALFLLFAVLTPLGTESKGIQAWFEVAGFQLQPAELAKLALIIGLAAFLTLEKEDIDGKRLATILGISAVPMALIMLQPDLGTVLVFGVMSLAIVFVAGARPRHFAVLLLIGIIGTIGILNSNVLADYQQDRLTNFANPELNADGSGYNQQQSQTAISAGQLRGQGLFEGTQTGLGFVPEQHTDFIFTVVGEELGFVGGAVVLGLLSVILWRVWRTAQLARDEFGMLVCVGVLAMLTFQMFENIGMTMGIMPVTGIPLPFMSYGGSSILTAFAAIGLVLNVHIHRFG
ncbi:MAG TPA: rod shape-determining protein RodA [Acidimicrobiales bacterium]|nr:rod shape-determining protein RodA [Acidimicrobiales bacterium]